MLPQVWKDPKLYESALTTFRNITCVQFYWEDSFEYIVDNRVTEDDFNYNDLKQAAYSHYCFARNVLEFGAPPEYGIYHAETAVKLQPDEERYHELLKRYKKNNGGIF